MAKPLKEPQPASAITNILEKETTAAAVNRANVQASGNGGKQTPEPTGEPVNRSREFHLTASGAMTLNNVVQTIGDEIGGSITNSHFMRAMLLVIEDALPAIAEEMRKLGPLSRPSNAVGFESAREHFERQIANALARAIRGRR